MKIAQEIKKLSNWYGDARLYKLSEPHAHYTWDNEEKFYDYVIVSAVVAPISGAETYIFPAAGIDADSPVSFSEMPGSSRGTLDHAKVLSDIGYEIGEIPQPAV